MLVPSAYCHWTFSLQEYPLSIPDFNQMTNLEIRGLMQKRCTCRAKTLVQYGRHLYQRVAVPPATTSSVPSPAPLSWARLDRAGGRSPASGNSWPPRGPAVELSTHRTLDHSASTTRIGHQAPWQLFEGPRVAEDRRGHSKWKKSAGSVGAVVPSAGSGRAAQPA